MGEENKIRDGANAVKDLLEAVPVYQDAIQPAARELGVALQTVVKTVHIALAPLSMLVWGYEKIGAYLEETLAEKLKHVPQEKILTPSPTVAGPILEALRFAGTEPDLRELYASLLATSMDVRTAEGAHPAFVDIIRQLSSDEARVLKFIASSYPSGMILLYGRLYIPMRASNDEPPSHRIGRVGWMPESESNNTPSFEISPSNSLAIVSNCQCPHLTQSYLDNLTRLGLLSISVETSDVGLGGAYFEIRDEEYLWETIRRYAQGLGLPEPNSVSFQGRAYLLTLTAFGKQFCRACVFEGASESTHARTI
jgi:hypothetical protein